MLPSDIICDLCGLPADGLFPWNEHPAHADNAPATDHDHWYREPHKFVPSVPPSFRAGDRVVIFDTVYEHGRHSLMMMNAQEGRERIHVVGLVQSLGEPDIAIWPPSVAQYYGYFKRGEMVKADPSPILEALVADASCDPKLRERARLWLRPPIAEGSG